MEAISPRNGDIHRVANGLTDRTSVSIHVYGGNIGAVQRATYALDGTEKRFVSGYASDVGTLRVTINRNIIASMALLYDPSLWSMTVLKGRGWFRETLAKTGDNTKIMLAGEYGLKHANFKGAVLVKGLA